MNLSVAKFALYHLLRSGAGHEPVLYYIVHGCAMNRSEATGSWYRYRESNSDYRIENPMS
jgi:hypothetical protein